MKKWICVLLVTVLVLALAVPASAASYEIVTPKWVTIDGKIEKGEWGRPIYQSISLNEALNDNIDDQITAWWYDTTNNKHAYFDLYVNHNDEAINIACVIHEVDPEISTDAAVWQQMGLTFTVGKYVEGTDVPVKPFQGEMYEHYTGYRIYQKADGVLGMKSMTLGMTARDLYANKDYIAVYDSKARTMTYEVTIPFVYTEIDPLEDEYMTFSAVIALDQYGNSVSGTVNGSNRWLIGTAAAFCGGAENFAHQGHCIRLKLVSPEKVEEYRPAAGPNAPTSVTIPQDLSSDMLFDSEHYEGEDGKIRLTVLIVCAAVVLLCILAVVTALILDRRKKAAPQSTGEESDVQ